MVNEATKKRDNGFKHLGIPREAVRLLESQIVDHKRIRVADPEVIAANTAALNAELTADNFKFQVSCLGYFECLRAWVKYSQEQFEASKNRRNLPNRSLKTIAIVLEAERLIRLKHKLSANPASGKERQEFEKEVQTLLEKMIGDCQEYRLRKQAVERLKTQGKTLPLTTEVNAMVEVIRAETTSDQARVAPANQAPTT